MLHGILSITRRRSAAANFMLCKPLNLALAMYQRSPGPCDLGLEMQGARWLHAAEGGHLLLADDQAVLKVVRFRHNTDLDRLPKTCLRALAADAHPYARSCASLGQGSAVDGEVNGLPQPHFRQSKKRQPPGLATRGFIE